MIPRAQRCKKPSRNAFSNDQLKKVHKVEMLLRRDRQFSRIPDLDARLVYFSKNSLPEYRKSS